MGMIRIPPTIALPFLLISGAACASVPSNPWAKVTTPAPGAPEAIGFYSSGCLRGAGFTLVDGEGYFSMRLSRRRNFGHPVLIQYIENISKRAVKENVGSILVGDLSMPRGGPTLSGHASHQSGLDVDFWFYDPVPAKLSLEDREQLSAQDILSADGNTLNPQVWNDTKKNLLRIAADHPDVERIFIDPLAKRALCNEFPGAPWLRKFRPLWHHHDHFHVRLRCPADSPLCRTQEAVPPGDGCGTELSAWLGPGFAEERRRYESAKIKEARLPRLPAACTDVLTF